MSAEFQVNTFTTDEQSTFISSAPTPIYTSQSVGVDSNGNYVIAWSSYSQDGSGWGIYAQRFAANGTKLGGEFKVNTYTSGDQLMPSVSMADTTGEFAITWTSLNQPGDGSNGGVFGQRYGADGAAVGSEFQVNTTTLLEQRYSAVAMDADGDLVVTWTSQFIDGSGTAVMMRRYNKATGTWGNEIQVNQTTTNDQRHSSIAMEANGDFVITWTSMETGAADIYARRFSADGTPLGNQFRVNTRTTGSQDESKVAMDADGDFVVTWTDNGQDSSSYGIYAQRYDSAGNAVGSEFKVNTYTTNQQRRPYVAMDDNGGFVITWSGSTQDFGSSWGVFGQRYDLNGLPQGTEFLVNDTIAGNQQFSPVGMDASGNFVVAWTSDTDVNGSYGVYAKQFAAIPNNAPTVTNVNKAIAEDTPLTFAATDFTAAFSDPDGSSLNRIKITTLPTKGTLKLNGVDIVLNQQILTSELGNLVYTPTENLNGGDSFKWNGSDGLAFAGSDALVGVSITPVNDAPLVGAIAQTVDEDTPVNFVLTDFTSVFSDVDGDALNKIKITTLPNTLSGTLTLNGTPVVADQEISTAEIANLTFTPKPNFNGAVTFDWNGFDGTVYATAPSTVTLTYTAINDAPVVTTINKTVAEDTDIIFSSGDFIGAYSDADADLLNKIIITSLPTHGVLLLNGVAVTVNQEIPTASLANLKYTPALNYNGVDTFGWNGFDGTTYATTGTTANLTVTAVNNAPTVSNVSKAGTEDTTVTFSSSDFSPHFADVDGNSLGEIQITSLPSNGHLKL
jgi:hypothetical protein